jgi:hypothetical protein
MAVKISLCLRRSEKQRAPSDFVIRHSPGNTGNTGRFSFRISLGIWVFGYFVILFGYFVIRHL